MILTKIQYETYNSKLLTIIEVLKSWYNYLKDYKDKVFNFVDNNNLHYFIDMKNLSSKQLC